MFHANRTFFFVNSLSRAANLAKLGIKSELDCIIHRTLVSSSLDCGGVIWLSTSTLAGSGRTPSDHEPIRRPQNSISGTPNAHLSGFSVIPALDMTFMTASIAWLCSAFVVAATMRSSWIRCA